MAHVLISLSSELAKFKWFKYDKTAVELSFDKLRHNKEYVLDIHPGNVFGVAPNRGRNYIVVHKENPDVQFTLTVAEVEKLEASSAGWKGKVKNVTVQAGVGGKDSAPTLPVVAPANKPEPKVEAPQIDSSANKHAVTVTDSKGQSFTLPNRSGRKLNYVVVATFPAHAPTSLSAGNPESRSAPGGHETQAQAIKQAKHLQKNFRAFNIEIIRVV